MSDLYFDAGPPAAGQKVCLATTAYGALDPAYVFALQQSRAALAAAGIGSAYLLLHANCHVDDARNTVVREFLLSDCTDLVFLDADVAWDTECLVELCQYQCDVVGGVYPYRREGMDGAMPVRPLLTGDAEPLANGLVEVEGLPAGFLRIRRSVLETMCEDAQHFWGQDDRRARIPLLFERTFDPATGIRWGGDIEFCRRWRARGGKVYVAPAFRLGHAGRKMTVDSLTAMMRRTTGVTLRHMVDAVRHNAETETDYIETFQYLDNPWGMPPTMLAVAVTLARQADGPILEAGSGLSSILMAAAAPDQTVFVLEHDPLYAAKLEQMASDTNVRIALCMCAIRDRWYDLSDYPDLPDRFAVGLNDGPPRRIGDRTAFFHRVGGRCDAILVDDADDPSYLENARLWAHDLGRRADLVDRRGLLIRKASPDA